MNYIKVILFIIPFIWSVVLVPFVNRVQPLVLGLPFLAFWEILGVLITSLCIGIMYYIDYKNEELMEQHK